VKPADKAYIEHRLLRAQESPDEVRVLIGAGHYRTAVSRLYYACFYAVSALLLTEGRRVSKHSGVRALFDQFWVNTGRVPVRRGRFYRRMFQHRQKADYADLATFEQAMVEGWLREAVESVQEIAELVEAQLREE